MTFCELWGYCLRRAILQKGFGGVTIAFRSLLGLFPYAVHLFIMVLDLRDVFAGVRDIPLDCDLPFEDYGTDGENPVSKLHFNGSIKH